MSAVAPTRVIGGRYVVLAELGRGGMGVVWRAEDRVMGRHVAVKELHLPAGLGQDERRLFRERLLREARTAGRLNHPGIVTVFDVVTDSGVDHIVMELIEARTLAEIVAASGPLDERSAVALAQQLLDALSAAHRRGVVHRDVKPPNVMVGSGGRVTLTDFGIAQASDDPRLTTTGAVIGSPGYLSPERLEGHPATPASDLWALGATLFFAVQGVGPFVRETTAATISAVLHSEVPVVRTRGPLGTVIGGLLQRSPQARLGAAQAAAMLTTPGTGPQPTVDDTRATTRPVTQQLAGAAPARQPRRWVAAALALALGLAAGLVGGIAWSRSEQSQATTLTYGEDGDIPAFNVSSASCLLVAPTPGQPIPSSATLDCDDRHLSELFLKVPTYSSTTVVAYPGETQMEAFGAASCRFYFDSELIVGADKAALGITAVVPSKASFELDTSTVPSYRSYSERDVYCLLTGANGGALEGTRIKQE